MAGISDPLLRTADEGGAKEAEVVEVPKSARPWPRKLYLAVGLLGACACGLACAGARSPKAYPTAALTSLVSGWGDAACYTVTGGTCMIYGCNADRGAVCGVGHNCVCESGCTGADGICRPTAGYQVIARNVRLRNAKFSGQYLYAPRSWFMEQLRVTDQKGKYADLWNIYKLPGKDYLWRQDMYFLSPAEFPEYAAGVANTKMEAYVPGKGGGDNSGFVVPVGSLFVVDLFHLTSRHGLLDRDPFNIGQVMNTLCRPREHPEAIQISGSLGQATWYVHHASWEVFGWVWSQPGEGGHWVPEPPLNHTLPFC